MAEFLNKIDLNVLLLIGNIILFLTLYMAMFFLVKALVENNVVNRIRQWIKTSENNRTTAEEQLRNIEGNQEKNSIFYTLDLTLNQSGIKKFIPFLSTEYLVLFSAVSAIAAFFITGIITEWSYGILAAFTVFFIPYLLVRIFAEINHKRIEEQIIHFLNMVDNYNQSEDNLITIFGKVYKYLDEPLCSAIEDCYREASNTGDMGTAFRRLETRIVHERFSEILQNLEMCSLHEANYHTIIKESRDIMIKHKKSRDTIKNIVNKAKMGMLAMTGMLVVLVFMISNIIEVNLITVMTGSVVGMAILIYLGLVMLFGVFSVIKIART